MPKMDEIVDMLTGGSTKDDEGVKYSKVQHPFDRLQKVEVLQEARIFHDSHHVREHPKQCCRILAQLLRLNDIGAQPFTETEATEVFFGATKLFVSEDQFLRRMVYLFLKEIYTLCDPNNVIIVTSSLTKDVTCDLNLYRANSLRVLVRIIDSAFLGAIERYIKQAIVDESSRVASSALVSSVHLYESSTDSAAIVRRWISETQQAISSRNTMVQFHGIQLLHLIKSHDRLGVSKLVSQFSQRKIKSPLARVLLVRYAAKFLRDEVTEGRVSVGGIPNTDGFSFLETSLKDSSEMVVYEAARALCTLPMTEPEDLNSAINRLQSFLKSSKPIVQYAGLRTLAFVAVRRPRLVAKCYPELKKLIEDKNRAVATLAVTTLLRTASESSIDELLSQISPVLDSIGDDYRISAVKSLLQLCLRFPSQYSSLVSFLSKFLKDRGTFEFKRSIVLGIVALIHAYPEAAETSLFHLCEYIEDCEYDWLSIEIIHVLGEIGPLTHGKSRYIRFIYNRTMLDQAQIRAAAVTALSRFAVQCPSLRKSILLLLNLSLTDEDNETRDRAILAVKTIGHAMKENPYVPPPVDADADDIPPDAPSKDDTAACVFSPLPMSFDQLERSLRAYQAIPGIMDNCEPITLSSLPIMEDDEPSKGVANGDVDGIGLMEGDESAAQVVTRKDAAAILYEIPELAAFGRVFRSCPPIQLTESETEYVVHCIKHVLHEHVILQFRVHNTIEDQRLDNVTVAVSPSDDAVYEVIGDIPADVIGYGDVGDCFTILKYNLSALSCSMACNMMFRLVSLAGGEESGDVFSEEYALEDFAISTSDYIAKVAVPDFRNAWEDLGADNEILKKFELQFKSQEEAVHAMLERMGMHACDNTDRLAPEGKPQVLHLSGIFVGGTFVLVRARLSTQKDASGVTLQIAVRSQDALVSRLVLDFSN
jgi:coatomer protein complex subunit gamma